MFPLETRYPTTAGQEFSKIADIQEKDFIISFMNMIDVLKEEMNTTLKEIHEKITSVNK